MVSLRCGGLVGRNSVKQKEVGGLGFRALSEFNQALVSKQAWRTLNYLQSLLGQVLKANYFPLASLLECTADSNASYVWHSVLWGLDLIISGVY